MSNAGPCACRSLSRDDDLQVSPTSTATTRMSPTTSRESGRRLSDLTNYRRDLAVLDPPRGHPNPANYAASLVDESADNMSIFSQFSPGLHGLGSRTGASSSLGMQDSPEQLYYTDGRRPSAASVTTTASSTGSKASGPRGGFRKLQGFFGEEFPGRDSSESSLPTSYMGKDQRSRSYSHTRPTHRDRNYSNATDHTRDASPASSRPRTPVPAPEVVPFLYQDNTVSPPCVSDLRFFLLPSSLLCFHLLFFTSLFFSPSFSPPLPYFIFLFLLCSLHVPASLFPKRRKLSSVPFIFDPLFFSLWGRLRSTNSGGRNWKSVSPWNHDTESDLPVFLLGHCALWRGSRKRHHDGPRSGTIHVGWRASSAAQILTVLTRRHRSPPQPPSPP